MNLVQKVRSLTDAIIEAKDPLQVQKDWETVDRLLGRLAVEADEAHAVCKARDSDALDALVSQVENPTPMKSREPDREIGDDEKLSAMKAFRKRLKLARLSDESKLGSNKLTGGRKSQIDAIIPPTKFAPEVWRALAKDGQLEDVTQGFYQLKA